MDNPSPSAPSTVPRLPLRSEIEAVLANPSADQLAFLAKVALERLTLTEKERAAFAGLLLSRRVMDRFGAHSHEGRAIESAFDDVFGAGTSEWLAESVRLAGGGQ